MEGLTIDPKFSPPFYPALFSRSVTIPGLAVVKIRRGSETFGWLYLFNVITGLWENWFGIPVNPNFRNFPYGFTVEPDHPP